MHNVQSPRTDDAGIEAEIQSKGKIAPRITPADIEANIASEHYFTASQAVSYVSGKTPPAPLDLLTFCVLVLRNGFTVTGESACASPENFDAEIGRKIARANAVSKVWPLMGYLLKDMLYVNTGVEFEIAKTGVPPYQQSTINEKRELDERLDKLNAFMDSVLFQSLNPDEANRMRVQVRHMTGYSQVLAERIAAF